MIVPVLSLTQPWATLVAIGAKKVETRSWKPPQWLNGKRIAIHASKGFPKIARETCESEPFCGYLRPYSKLPLGAVIATVTVMGARLTQDVQHQLTFEECAFGDYSPGRWAWFLSEPILLKQPIPAKGSLGIWKFDLPEVQD